MSWRREPAIALALFAAVSSTACAPSPPLRRPPILVGPSGEVPMPSWTTEEEKKAVAVKELRRTEAASHHVIRLHGAEPPHTHDRHDLAVFVLSGAVRMHIADRVVPVDPGDVIDIPRGVPHWAENAAPGPSFAYVVFAPPFDGKDRRPVGSPAPSPAAAVPATAPAPAAAPPVAPPAAPPPP